MSNIDSKASGPTPPMTEIPKDALAVWRKPDRAISPVAIVATVDADGSARTAPFGSLQAVTSRLIRFASSRYHDTYLNLCRDNRITVALLSPPNIALTVRGQARVIKESMDSYEKGAIIEVDVEEVKNDMVHTLRLDSGITITSQEGFEWWFDGIIGEMEL